MRIFVLILAALLSFSSFADDRTDKIRALMEAQGHLAAFQQQIAAEKDGYRAQAEQMIEQAGKGMNLDKSCQAKFKSAIDEFVASAHPDWKAEELVNVWANYYAPHFTNEELDQLLAFYKAPLGRKTVVAGREAMEQYIAHFQKEAMPNVEKATGTFMQRLQTIQADGSCTK